VGAAELARGMTSTWPLVLERGVAGLAHVGEGRSGDLAVFAPSARGGLLAVIDGLGHGDAAADASEAAAEVLHARVDDPPQRLLEHCHEELRHTRGAVMTLAWFDVEERSMSWTGVGNVEARFIRAGDGPDARYDSPVVLGGVVGYNLPRVRMSTLALEPGDAVVIATDGVAADYSASIEPGVAAQELAERVLERHGKGTDDALAAVVRYLGPPARTETPAG
jgi:negative regulator of sigma-B (phosphoserine phosphatase)